MPTRKANLTRKMDKLEALRTAIQAGEKSGIATGDVFEDIFNYIRQLAAENTKVPARNWETYQQAHRRALARLRRGYDLRQTTPCSRDEIHERE